MADQTAVNGGARLVAINSPLVEGVVGNLANFSGDIATLTELQAKLAVHDLKDSAGKAALPVVSMAVAIALGLGAVPIALFGAAELLAPVLGLKLGWTLLIVAGASLAGAGVLAWLGASGLGKSFESFRRTREELTRNVAWIKTVLANSGRPAPHHQRKL